MVLQKKLEYGFNGYQVPRGARSARRRTLKKKAEDNQMCAFDLLATVAGKILIEKGGSLASSNMSAERDQSEVVKNPLKNENQDDDKQVNLETHDHVKNEKVLSASELISKVDNQSGSHPGFVVSSTSDCSDSLGYNKMVTNKTREQVGYHCKKVNSGSSRKGSSSNCKLECKTRKHISSETINPRKMIIDTRADMCSVENMVIQNGKPCLLVCSDSNVKKSLYRDHASDSSSLSRDNVKVVIRDDDENSSGCTHPISTAKFFRSPMHHVADRRIKKLSASKYWKLPPNLKDKFLGPDADSKHIYQKPKNCYKCPKSQKNFPYKKRKFFRCSSYSDSDGGISSNGISDSIREGNNGYASGSTLKMHAGSILPVGPQQSPLQSKNSHVKLRIKSFRVPELIIEVPETATVGSLKRSVTEAVTALLGGGLHIGVVVRGKNIEDDNETLLQSGISGENQPDSLGFTLEPNSTKTTQPLCVGDPLPVLPCNEPQLPTSISPTPASVHEKTATASLESYLSNTSNLIESDHDSAPLPIGTSSDKKTADSKELVAVPAMNSNALAVVPVNQKAKRSDNVQRRIRRPFSVVEVEALVQAVEKLGTGRWRDVKLQAFDDAKHRTYVDLKDKWKTLVHTARIAPQQRRGEPVPQELLDRVLTAHAYWSQQAKQQDKPHPETCLLL